MKTKSKFFRNLGKVTLVLSVLFISSCGSDDDGGTVIANVFATLPADVLDTYDGELTYTPADGMGIVAGVEGTATISRSGETYTISFSNEVPAITGLRFIGEDDGNYASVGTDGSATGISIDDDELTVGAAIDGNAWAFVPN
ncbi:hypothetical protein [Aquimarina sp. RZ0]|uniref:hypothetical protein n=1 Tax=Aquimarina sp. RZ0 TaxID=2607730 RepID=UPI0011F12F35|nr:hypothetical protein [Aquimarina sp. RZ0]KAA1244002.1 hypothetical protein F0000_18380 [Aquimarina sp. RZ0]